jgi:4-hydroxyphenylpyruvate dioxygenase
VHPTRYDGGESLTPDSHDLDRDATTLPLIRAAIDRGLPLLAIPGNYYDDLLARTGLDEQTVERMAELGVLYDATSDGELLHVYTELVGPGLFFEVVERRGAYDGYGAPNSPVRVAAQR